MYENYTVIWCENLGRNVGLPSTVYHTHLTATETDEINEIINAFKEDARRDDIYVLAVTAEYTGTIWTRGEDF